MFPDTNLNEKNIASVSGAWFRNAVECVIVKHGGGLKKVGVVSALTGSKIDVLIIDDVSKDAEED